VSKYDRYKEEVLRCSQRLFAEGFNVGTSGNVSVLVEGEEAVAVTPSGRPYLDLSPADICVARFDLGVIEGQWRPSVETGMHVEVYRGRPDAGAVIHTHQRYASVLAIIGKPLPPLFDDQALNLGPGAGLVPYAPSGTPDLAANVAAKLADRANAYLLQSHGALVLGADLAEAYRNATLLEHCCRVYCDALATGSEVTPLPEQLAAALGFALRAKQDAAAARRSGGASGAG
jgi:L-fuculose-phosphate aldolase